MVGYFLPEGGIALYPNINSFTRLLAFASKRVLLDESVA